MIIFFSAYADDHSKTNHHQADFKKKLSLQKILFEAEPMLVSQHVAID